ncbi:MAG: hypothetical protein FVQ80_11555 [Planctomycetes bacterium]|nr:hypothetical protein [Planctomycetota bacterium]
MDAEILYNESFKIMSAGPLQRRVFRYWTTHNRDPVYESMTFDTETTGLTFGIPGNLKIGNTVIKVNNITPFGISLCIPYKEQLALFWGRLGTPLYDECLKILKMKGPKNAHNSRYDLRVFAVNNRKVRGPVDCTLTMARIIWNRRQKFDLKTLTSTVAPELYGYDDDLKGVLRNLKSSHTRAGYPKGYVNYSFLPDEIISEYAMIDAFVTWLLNFKLMPEILKIQKAVYRRERKIISIILKSELRGVQLDRRQARNEAAKLKSTLPSYKARLYKLARKKFNERSPKQLLPILRKQFDIPKKMLTKVVKGERKLTTEHATLEKVMLCMEDKRLNKFLETLFQVRRVNKLVGTYLEPLYDRAKYNNGIVYCNINPTDTRTGRMASNNPNLHNIPRPDTGVGDEQGNPIRHCFVCRKGFTNLLSDYEQMEMWMYAAVAGSNRMMRILQEGGDIHASAAYQIFGEEAVDNKHGQRCRVLVGKKFKWMMISKLKRFQCKKVNFGVIYGMGFRALALQIKTKELEARDLLQEWHGNNPEMRAQNALNESLLKKYGFVEDFFGRRYNIRVKDAYKAINAQVQGGCAQALKIALINVEKYFDSLPSYNDNRFATLLLIHDELMAEMPNAARLVWPKIIAGIEHRMKHIPQLEDRGIILNVDSKITQDAWDGKRAIGKILRRQIDRVLAA